MNYYPKSRKTDIVTQNFDSEILVYDLQVHKAYCLNKTSRLIWDMCDGKTDVSEISRKLSVNTKQKVGEELVWLAIEQLKKQNLLENVEEAQPGLKGMSRREIIRRGALASAVALPAISILTAPTAVMAQSCFNSGGSPSNTLVGACTAGVGQPPATLASCTGTCQNVFGADCVNCTTFATPSPSTPGVFLCRCT